MDTNEQAVRILYQKKTPPHPWHTSGQPAACKGACTFAPGFRTPLRSEAGRMAAQPPSSVSQVLITFQNINLLLIKGCLNPRKLLKYASILLI